MSLEFTPARRPNGAVIYWVLLSFICTMGTAALAQIVDPMMYGNAYLAEGDDAAAMMSYAEALRTNPSNVAALNNMGVAKANAGYYQTAHEFLIRAQKLAPERADIRENLASVQNWTRTYGSGNDAASTVPNTAALIPEPPALWPAGIPQGAGAASARQSTSDCGTTRCK